MKKFRNALLVASASTGMLFIYYWLSGQSEEIGRLWVTAVAMFFGVFAYLIFAGRRSRTRRGHDRHGK